jgi:signal transduction histidine kinase
MRRVPQTTKGPRREQVAAPEEPAKPHLAKGTRDVTDQANDATARVTSEQVRELSERTRRARAIDDDIASVAHDVKTPLSIIMLEANVLEERLGRALTPQARHGLDRILTNATYIDRLVSDLLDLGCHDAGQLEIRRERIDLGALIEAALERAVSTRDLSRISIDVHQHATIIGDPVRIERVLSNLVANAFKHGARRAPVAVKLEVDRKLARVSVIDSGPGLPAEQCQELFDRYRRGKARNDGYGLGLYISRRIIEAHGGRIGVHSAPGKGCRFWFELPLTEASGRASRSDPSS